jgi:hypothetical protein
LGGFGASADPTHVVVTAIDPNNYQVDFGQETAGQDQPRLQVLADDPLHPLNLSGFLPGVTVTTLQKPFMMEDIPVSELNPSQTAVAIQSYFQQTAAAFTSIVAPFDFPPDSRVVLGTYEAPYDYPVPSMVGTDPLNPLPMSGYDPGVTVRPVIGTDGKPSFTDFDIWFTGVSGKKIFAPLVVTAATGDAGENLHPEVNAKVTILKQTSPEFRVNPSEPDNPFTLGPDVWDQDQPAVGVDPDGDFTIAWRSVVPEWVTPGSKTDIFARRFSPAGITASYAPGTFVPGQITTGVRALARPTAVAGQRLTFDATGSVPLKGTFRLRMGDATTSSITFTSADLTATAANIQKALVALGHTGVTVTVLPMPNTPTRFIFVVRFAGEPGVVQPPIQYVPASTPMKATCTQSNASGDMYTFRVNTNTANPQAEPAVAMGEDGSLAIVWADQGQDISFFNNIEMQRYDRDGRPVGSPTTVDVDRTNIQFAPDVALGRDGYAVVTWSETDDAGYLSKTVYVSTVWARAYDTASKPLWLPVNIGGGGHSTVAMDIHDNFTIGWQVLADRDNIGAISVGVHGREFALLNAAGLPLAAPQQTRAEFRVNSGNANPATNTLWPFYQAMPQVVSDFDGDLVFTYEGVGPDASDEVDIPASFFQPFFRDSKTGLPINQDLLPYFNPFPHNGLPGDVLSSFAPHSGFLGYDEIPQTWDVSLAIDQFLFWVQYECPNGTLDPLLPADAEKLGRLRQIMESVAGALRGEGYGTLLSRWDADPNLGTLNPTYVDCIANSLRDGRNQRWYLEIPGYVEQGSFLLRVWVNGIIKDVPITIPAAGQFTKFNEFTLERILETSLEAALGTNWPRLDGSGCVDVRQVHGAESFIDEIDGRLGTPWEIYPVDPNDYNPDPGPPPQPDWTNTPVYHGATLYEIRFQGEMHDTLVDMWMLNPQAQRWRVPQPPPPPPGQQPQVPPPVLEGTFLRAPFEGDTRGFEGTEQYNTSLAMTPSGSLVSVYTELELTTQTALTLVGEPIFSDAGAPVSQNILYRQFQESTDTAGPRITGIADANGRYIRNDGKVAAADVQHIVITFNEEMMAGSPYANPDSVLNPRNYRIIDGKGNEIANAVVSVDYGMNKAAELSQLYGLNPVPTNKWEVVLTIDGQPGTAGVQALPDGSYTLSVAHAVPTTSTTVGQIGLRDLAGNPLFSTGFTPAGSDYTTNFTVGTGAGSSGGAGSPQSAAKDPLVNATTAGNQNAAEVATDGGGNYVVVWVSYATGNGNIVGQRFGANGDPIGPEFIVNSRVAGNQVAPSVAMTPTGEFVVVWSGSGQYTNATNNPSDVFVQQYDAEGRAIGQQNQVNDYLSGTQGNARVAMADDGRFVITWSSTSSADNNHNGIFARRYGSRGQALADEFRVSATSKYLQQTPDVAMDGKGNFTIVWAGSQTDGNGWGVVKRSYTASGSGKPQSVVNTQTGNDQLTPRIAMSPAGDFVVTWASFQAPGKANPQPGYDIFARRFGPGGANKDAAEFRVNVTTAYNQITPDVGMDFNGGFTVVWTSYNQDNAESGNPALKDYGVYARMYKANRSDYSSEVKEFRVNATVRGNQVTPAVDRRTSTGDGVIAWVSADGGGTGVYCRQIGAGSTVAIVAPTTKPTVAKPSMSINSQSAVQGTSAATKTVVTFTVTLSSAATAPVTVRYATASGTATAGKDFGTTSGTLTIPAGKKTGTINVLVYGSAMAEKPEKFYLKLSSATGATISTGTGICTISDRRATAPAPTAALKAAAPLAAVPAQSALAPVFADSGKLGGLLDLAQTLAAKKPAKTALEVAVDTILAAQTA